MPKTVRCAVGPFPSSPQPKNRRGVHFLSYGPRLAQFKSEKDIRLVFNLVMPEAPPGRGPDLTFRLLVVPEAFILSSKGSVLTMLASPFFFSLFSCSLPTVASRGLFFFEVRTKNGLRHHPSPPLSFCDEVQPSPG